jgi:hypothetical protein
VLPKLGEGDHGEGRHPGITSKARAVTVSWSVAYFVSTFRKRGYRIVDVPGRKAEDRDVKNVVADSGALACADAAAAPASAKKVARGITVSVEWRRARASSIRRV